MKRFQLATLIKWSGTLNTRKRLQKVVFLLDAAGCQLDADFVLHHYGPYSHDVASLTDEMVRAKLLVEEKSANVIVGTSFSYRLSEAAQEQLERIEKEHADDVRLRNLLAHEGIARRLLTEPDLRKLELAATVAYFYRRKTQNSWDSAREAAAKFKCQQADGVHMRSAEQLAREVISAN